MLQKVAQKYKGKQQINGNENIGSKIKKKDKLGRVERICNKEALFSEIDLKNVTPFVHYWKPMICRIFIDIWDFLHYF